MPHSASGFQLGDNRNSPFLIGVGKSGCRIAGEMQDAGFQAGYHFVSLNPKDLGGRSSFVDWRTLDDEGLKELLGREAEGRGQCVVFGGLGGRSGSYLLPRAVSAARKAGLGCLAVVLLPFNEQRDMEFAAGAALERVRKEEGTGIIVVDREQFVEEAFEELPIGSVHDAINRRVAGVMASVLEEGEAPIGSGGESLLEIRDAGEGFSKAMGGLTRRTWAMAGSAVDDLLVLSSGNRPTTLGNAGLAAEGLRNMVSSGSRIRYLNSASISGGSVLAVVAHTASRLSLRVYDPLESILGDRTIDAEPESGLRIPLALDRVD